MSAVIYAWFCSVFLPFFLAFRDNDGNPMVLPVVAKVEKQLADQIVDKTLNHEYLSIDGLKSFTEAACKLVLGNDSPAIAENRVSLFINKLQFPKISGIFWKVKYHMERWTEQYVVQYRPPRRHALT